MRLFFLSLCGFLFFNTAPIAYGQDPEYVEDYPAEYSDWLFEGAEVDPPTKEDFLILDNTSKYASLKKKRKAWKGKTQKLKGHQYEDLMAQLKRDFGVAGFVDVRRNITWRTPYTEVGVTGLNLEAILPSKAHMKLSIMDETYVDALDGYAEAGGAFHLLGDLNWEQVELGINNNFIYASHKRGPSGYHDEGSYRGDQVEVSIQLTDYALLTITEEEEIRGQEALIEWATKSVSKQLLGLLNSENFKHVEMASFLDHLKSAWKINLSTNQPSYKGEGQDFIFDGNLAGYEEQAVFAYSCEASSKDIFRPYELMEDMEAYDFPMGDMEVSPPPVEELEKEGVLLQLYETYGREGKVRRLYATDGKSFVDLPLSGDEDLDAWVKKIASFFAGPVNCDVVTQDKKHFRAAQWEMLEFVGRYQEKMENERIEGFISEFKSQASYQEYLKMMGNLPSTDGKINDASGDLKAQFEDVLSPIANQLETGVFQQKGLKVIVLPFEGLVEIPGIRLFAQGKIPGKQAEYGIGIFLVNPQYARYLSYYLKEAASLMIPFDGEAFGAFVGGQLSINLDDNLSSYFFKDRRAPVGNLGVPIAEHAVFYISAPSFDYSRSEIQGILASLSSGKLADFAAAHQDLDSEYWDAMRVFPSEIEGKKRAIVLHNNKNAANELKLRNYEGEILMVGYNKPLTKISGGHFYFMTGCGDNEGNVGFQEMIESFQVSETKQKGKYLMRRGTTPDTRNPVSGRVWILSHTDAPNKHIIYTLDQEFEEAQLKTYFDKFFTVSINCEVLREGK